MTTAVTAIAASISLAALTGCNVPGAAAGSDSNMLETSEVTEIEPPVTP